MMMERRRLENYMSINSLIISLVSVRGLIQYKGIEVEDSQQIPYAQGSRLVLKPSMHLQQN